MTAEQARAAARLFAAEYFDRVPGAWRRRFGLHCAGALVEVASAIFRRQEAQWPEKVAAAGAAGRGCPGGANRAPHPFPRFLGRRPRPPPPPPPPQAARRPAASPAPPPRPPAR